MKGMVLLETPRLYLRRFTSEDAALLHELDSDPEVMRYLTKGVPTPLEVIAGEILPRWLAYYETSDHLGFWAAHETATDRFAGWFQLRPDRLVPGATEVGYRLRRAAWGQGYATEGTRALICKAVGEWDIGYVTAATLVDNQASRRVMEKCGMSLEEEFIYPVELLPGWTEHERRAVRYGIRKTIPPVYQDHVLRSSTGSDYA